MAYALDDDEWNDAQRAVATPQLTVPRPTPDVPPAVQAMQQQAQAPRAPTVPGRHINFESYLGANQQAAQRMAAQRASLVTGLTQSATQAGTGLVSQATQNAQQNALTYQKPADVKMPGQEGWTPYQNNPYTQGASYEWGGAADLTGFGGYKSLEEAEAALAKHRGETGWGAFGTALATGAGYNRVAEANRFAELEKQIAQYKTDAQSKLDDAKKSSLAAKGQYIADRDDYTEAENKFRTEQNQKSLDAQDAEARKYEGKPTWYDVMGKSMLEQSSKGGPVNLSLREFKHNYGEDNARAVFDKMTAAEFKSLGSMNRDERRALLERVYAERVRVRVQRTPDKKKKRDDDAVKFVGGMDDQW